jgi:hypothetical protein
MHKGWHRNRDEAEHSSDSKGKVTGFGCDPTSMNKNKHQLREDT